MNATLLGQTPTIAEVVDVLKRMGAELEKKGWLLRVAIGNHSGYSLVPSLQFAWMTLDGLPGIETRTYFKDDNSEHQEEEDDDENDDESWRGENPGEMLEREHEEIGEELQQICYEQKQKIGCEIYSREDGSEMKFWMVFNTDNSDYRILIVEEENNREQLGLKFNLEKGASPFTLREKPLSLDKLIIWLKGIFQSVSDEGEVVRITHHILKGGWATLEEQIDIGQMIFSGFGKYFNGKKLYTYLECCNSELEQEYRMFDARNLLDHEYLEWENFEENNLDMLIQDLASPQTLELQLGTDDEGQFDMDIIVRAYGVKLQLHNIKIKIK